MATLNDIKKKYCIDENIVNFMGHRIPEVIFTALHRFEESNTDQSQTGFFGSPERKKRFIDFTNSMVRYIEQNIKKADPKEQGYIEKKLKTLKADRDRLVSKFMVLKGRGK